MAKNFKELQAKMTPEQRARSQARVEALVAEMAIADLSKELSDALRSLDRGDRVAAARVERWAAALDHIDRDHPDPGSRRFSATQLRTRAAQGNPASLKTEIRIVLAKLAHWRSLDIEQASDA